MAAIPDWLISTVWPFSRPHVLELILISTPSLNRGWRRASIAVARRGPVVNLFSASTFDPLRLRLRPQTHFQLQIPSDLSLYSSSAKGGNTLGVDTQLPLADRRYSASFSSSIPILDKRYRSAFRESPSRR